MKRIGSLVAVLFLANPEIWAQGCVTCTQTAAGLGEASAQGLNNGILYLAAIPLIFIFTVGYIWYKRSKSTAHTEE